jgi:hypothetical protein
LVSLTLTEENRLRVFKNRQLRKIFGPKSDEVTGEWRKLHNEEFHILHSSPDIIRQVKSRIMMSDMWHAWERRGKCTGFWSWSSLAGLLHACQYTIEDQRDLFLPRSESDSHAWVLASSFFHVRTVHAGRGPRLLVPRSWPTLQTRLYTLLISLECPPQGGV